MLTGRDATFFRTLMAYYTHQDRLVWGRAQLLVAVQGAVLFLGFDQSDSWIGVAITFGGAVFTFLILLLILRDIDFNNHNRPIIQKLGDKLVPDTLYKELVRELECLECQSRKGSLTASKQLRLAELGPLRERAFWVAGVESPRWRRWATGYSLFKWVLSSFIIFDTVLGTTFLVKLIFPAN